MATSRLVSLNENYRNLLFGQSYDFEPNTVWMHMLIQELEGINGDTLCAFTAKNCNFNIVTANGKKITAFVRHSHEQRTACVGVEKGSTKKGYPDDVLTKMVTQAYLKLTSAPKLDVDVELLPRALADFDGEAYGPEYLTFSQGDAVQLLPLPHGVKDEGWALGATDAREGWYPPHYVQRGHARIELAQGVPEGLG